MKKRYIILLGFVGFVVFSIFLLWSGAHIMYVLDVLEESKVKEKVIKNQELETKEPKEKEAKKELKDSTKKELKAWAKKNGKFRALKKVRNKYSGRIKLASRKFNVDSKIIVAIIVVESDGIAKKKSYKGAKGLMGLMPRTARAMGANDIFHEYENIFAGTKYIKKMLDRFNGNISIALAAYNAGPAKVKKYGGIPPYKETKNYVRRVMYLASI